MIKDVQEMNNVESIDQLEVYNENDQLIEEYEEINDKNKQESSVIGATFNFAK
jgi:hypothetical protein